MHVNTEEAITLRERTPLDNIKTIILFTVICPYVAEEKLPILWVGFYSIKQKIDNICKMQYNKMWIFTMFESYATFG